MTTIYLIQSIAAEMSFQLGKMDVISFKSIISNSLVTSLFENTYYYLNALTDKFALASSVTAFFSYLLKYYSLTEDNAYDKILNVSPKINCALDYINEYCLDSDISLEEIAQVASLNKYYFIREFKRQYGITPIYYLNIKRINKAKEMLLDSPPLSEIAYSCGFNDQAYFSNVFRKFFGYSPVVFKNLCHFSKI